MDAVEPPKGLHEDAHNDWYIVTKDLADRQLLTDAMLGVVEMYCVALWTVRICQKAIQDHGLFVKGAGGALKTNPASTNLQKAQDTVSRMSVELGLTPSSRARRGLGGPAPSAESEADAQGV